MQYLTATLLRTDVCSCSQVGCKVRFTLTVRMREDLQPFCEVMYFEHEHSGHVGSEALPDHRRQRWLSDAAVQHVSECLAQSMPTAAILSENMLRVERDWRRVHGHTASKAARSKPPGRS